MSAAVSPGGSCKAVRPTEATAPCFSILTFNVLKDGFHEGPSAHDQWDHRGPQMIRIVDRLKPSIVCLQEVQTSTRGWGRLDNPADHAAWIRKQFAGLGLNGGIFEVRDADFRASSVDATEFGFVAPRSRPECRPPQAAPPAPATTTDAGGSDFGAIASTARLTDLTAPEATPEVLPRTQMGTAIFWRGDEFQCIARNVVSFSTIFRDLIPDKNAVSGKSRNELAQWYTAPVVHLFHRASGKDMLVVSTHMPAPNDTNDKPSRLQVQYMHALGIELDCYCSRLGGPIPILFAGDFNAKPADGAIILLKKGVLEPGHAHLVPWELKGLRTPAKVKLPFPAPRMPVGMTFTSAYEALNGCEPPFTNYVMRERPLALAAARTPGSDGSDTGTSAASEAAVATSGGLVETGTTAHTSSAKRVAGAAVCGVSSGAAPALTPAAAATTEAYMFKGVLDYIMYTAPYPPAAADADIAVTGEKGSSNTSSRSGRGCGVESVGLSKPATASTAASSFSQSSKVSPFGGILTPVWVLGTPTEAEVAKDAPHGYPTVDNPSDHIPLMARFTLL